MPPAVARDLATAMTGTGREGSESESSTQVFAAEKEASTILSLDASTKCRNLEPRVPPPLELSNYEEVQKGSRDMTPLRVPTHCLDSILR